MDNFFIYLIKNIMNIENWDDREAVDNVGNNRDKIQQTDDKEVIKDEKKWEVPDLKTLTKEDFKGVKKIEFVVHPLYRFLFESQLNAETQYIDGDFDQILLHCFNKLCGEDSKIDHVNVCLGPAFLTLMEMVEEIQDYMKPIQE